MANLPTIERAVDLLRNSDYTIAILTSSGEAITSRERGVATLMRLLAERAEVLQGAVVAAIRPKTISKWLRHTVLPLLPRWILWMPRAR